MSFTELENNALALDEVFVNAITRVNKTVSYFIDGTAHDVVYADQASAILAYADFIASKNIPPPVTIGDVVRLRGGGNKNTSENLDYTVTHVPNAIFPWWSLLGNQTGSVYIMTLGDVRILEIVPPP